MQDSGYLLYPYSPRDVILLFVRRVSTVIHQYRCNDARAVSERPRRLIAEQRELGIGSDRKNDHLAHSATGGKSSRYAARHDRHSSLLSDPFVPRLFFRRKNNYVGPLIPTQ